MSAASYSDFGIPPIAAKYRMMPAPCEPSQFIRISENNAVPDCPSQMTGSRPNRLRKRFSKPESVGSKMASQTMEIVTPDATAGRYNAALKKVCHLLFI
ncbi:hypothetical protein D1872_263590 [compost metagenome]